MKQIGILVMTSCLLRVAGVLQARREVSDLVSSMVEAGGALPLPEDRLLTIMEAAQVLTYLFGFFHALCYRFCFPNKYNNKCNGALPLPCPVALTICDRRPAE